MSVGNDFPAFWGVGLPPSSENDTADHQEYLIQLGYCENLRSSNVGWQGFEAFLLFITFHP